LIQTAQHHLSKAGRKASQRAIHLNRLLGEVIDGLDINGFSSVLSLEQQGRFALGYYHQRQSFFRKSADIAEDTTDPATDSNEVTPA
jgi:CRISPR-associated protein Csd1